MAKSKETFNKKEKEKRRNKQKQEKKQKMEERKANKKKGTPLEDMLAYLDEDGNLTNTPPDPRAKKVFRQEDIRLGVPKQEDANTVRKGTVSFFNKPKGFGFINDLDTNERLFFHIKDVLSPLEEADKVTFLAERGPRGMNAVQVTKLV